MGFDRTISLTERFLLNGYVLDVICPTNCEKNKIKQSTNSIVETLINSPKDIFANEIKTGRVHYVTKPLKAVLRVAVIGFALLTVSPLGMMIHGGLAVSHLAHYSFKAYVQGEKSNEKWNTVDSYARACLRDFSCFAVAALSAICFYTAFNAAKKLSSNFDNLSYSEKENSAKCVLFLPLTGLGMLAPSAFYPSYYLSSLIGDADYRTGMYISLEARNALGLVDENGNLLNFSPSDKLHYNTESYRGNTTYHFSGRTLDALCNLVVNAEFDLIDLVKDLNIWNKENRHEQIPYTYPLNGSQIAHTMEMRIQEKQKNTTMQLGVADQNSSANKNILKMIYDLKKLHHKITAFNDFLYDTRCLSIKGSIQYQIFQSLDKNAPTVPIDRPSSYVPEREYNAYLKDSVGSQEYGANASEFEQIRECLNRNSSLNRSKSKDATYEAFFNDLVEGEKSFATLFGLIENFSRTDYNKAWRRIALAIHPDKNLDRKEEAEVLTQAFVIIRVQLEKDLEKRSKPQNI